MSEKKRQPNSHECAYFGRKLSCANCDGIEVQQGYICIGSDGDDSIYFEDTDMDPSLKERVKITCMNDSDPGWYFRIDLEDILIFAAKNCRGIYERVLSETEGIKW